MSKTFIKVALKKNSSYENSINEILNHKDCPSIIKIKFAYYCASDLEQYYSTEKYPKIYKTRQICLKLLADYISEPNKSNIKKLTNAADAAFKAAATAAAKGTTAPDYAAAYAANAVTNATAQKDQYNYLISLIIEKYNLNQNTIRVLYE